jgi:pyruvate,water dikinase
LLEERLGEKSTAIRCAPGGETEEVEVERDLVEAPCLDARDLQRLGALAHQCEAVFGKQLDLEWAFAGDDLYLLQSRPITTRV